MKNIILITSLLCPIIIFGQDLNSKSSQNNDFILSLMELKSRQIYDTANYYFNKNKYNEAAICYNLSINAFSKSDDIIQQKLLVKSYNRLAYICISISDYRMAYDLLMKKLLICEKYIFIEEMVIAYLNMGVICQNLNQPDMAKQLYLKGLNFCSDTTNYILLYNNLADNDIERGKLDSANFYVLKALQLSKEFNETHMYSLLNTYATYYKNKNLYDSAFYYFRLSLRYSSYSTNEARNLTDISKIFFEVNNIDSALYYINLSNKIASENHYLMTLADNYLTLSKIEQSKGRYKQALEYHIAYTDLKDSIQNAEVFNGVNLIQRQYEVSKYIQHIEELEIDRKIKENTIRYQKILLVFTLIVLLLTIIVLAIIFSQKKKLNEAYKILVDKNIEITELQNNTSEQTPQKTSQSALSDDAQKALIEKILIVMENPEIICDASFTINKLTKLVKSNYLYVSKAINDGLKTNFRALLNKNRIREAKRLLANNEATLHTIEFVANKVGYKSQTTFRDAFKENTGVNPHFYLKSLKNQSS